MKFILTLLVIIFNTQQLILGSICCQNGSCCSCCPCCNNNRNILNKYMFLDGTIDIQTVVDTKTKQLEIVKSICYNTNQNHFFSSFKKFLSKLEINNNNKINIFINFTAIIYLLNLVNNFITSNKNKGLAGWNKNLNNLLSFIDQQIIKVFQKTVSTGEEKAFTDLIIDTRKKANTLFEKTMNTKDVLTGFKTDF